MDNYQPRRKGFSFLSFLLGFLIGIIFLVGAVAGVVIYALTAKIDTVFGIVGIDNGKDENGKNHIINTDADNGGAETLLQLFTKVSAFAGNTSELSVGEVENLIPAVGGLVDGFHSMLNSYLEIEREELVAVKFSQFGEYVSGKLLDIEPAALMNNLGMGELLDNKIMSLILEGKEASYVEVGSEKYPVYFDTYNLVDDAWRREGDEAILPHEYEEYLYEKNESSRINYYIVGETAFVTDENCTYSEPVTRSGNIVYLPYTPEYATLSGNYYYDGDEKIVVTRVTLGALSNGGFGVLDEVYIKEFIGSGDDLTSKIFGDITLGDVINGNVDFSEVVNSLTLEEVMTISPDDKILSQIKDATIATLPEKIGAITINSMYASEIYKTDELELAEDYEAAYLYYTADGELVKMEGGELGKLTEEEFEAGEYYTYGQAQGEWKILLYSQDSEKAYTVNNMSDMINNVSENMQKSTLSELDAAGILEFPEGSLEKTVNGRALGTMTILEVINYVVMLPST